MEGDASFDDLRQLLPQNMYEDILEDAIRKNIFPFNRLAGTRLTVQSPTPTSKANSLKSHAKGAERESPGIETKKPAITPTTNRFDALNTVQDTETKYS